MASDASPSTTAPAAPAEGAWSWHKLIDAGELPEGRVTTVTVS